MSTEQAAWDHPYQDVRVKFGQRPNQTLPLELAEAVLTELRDRDPVAFGEALSRHLVGADSVRARRNGNGRRS